MHILYQPMWANWDLPVCTQELPLGLWYGSLAGAVVIAVLELPLVSICGTTGFSALECLNFTPCSCQCLVWSRTQTGPKGRTHVLLLSLPREKTKVGSLPPNDATHGRCGGSRRLWQSLLNFPAWLQWGGSDSPVVQDWLQDFSEVKIFLLNCWQTTTILLLKTISSPLQSLLNSPESFSSHHHTKTAQVKSLKNQLSNDQFSFHLNFR